MTIVLRKNKSSALIHDELDGNFEDLLQKDIDTNQSINDKDTATNQRITDHREETALIIPGLYTDGYWTEEVGELTVSKIGQNSKPDYDYANRGMLFPQDNVAEYIQGIQQMDHGKKLGTALRFHVHFVQTTAILPIFMLDYKFFNNGEEIPVSDTTISTNDGLGPKFTFITNPILQLIRFPDIPAPSNEDLSAHFEYNLYRNDNLITGDVLAKYADFHYFKDTSGSIEEYSKVATT